MTANGHLGFTSGDASRRPMSHARFSYYYYISAGAETV
jgi:hypothetical protein